MNPPLLRPLATALHHEQRRRQQLPPLNDLPIAADTAEQSVRQEELRRAEARLGMAYKRAVMP